MYLIEACPVPTPADAERLLADLWQLTAGRGLGLHLLGVGARVMLGVTSAHPGIEEAAASTIADQCGGAVEAGWVVFEILEAASEIAAVNLVPTNRHIAVESRSFGWQRSDPLRGTFLALDNAPPGTVAGVALSLRALPDLGFALSLGAFAAGFSAASQAARADRVRLAGMTGAAVQDVSPRMRVAYRELTAAVARLPARARR